jgi:tetratricopeptide (TPR) repeat protein
MSHQKGVSIKPDYFEAFNNMGNVFEDNDDLDLAIEAYKKALNIWPDRLQACQNVAKRPTGLLKAKPSALSRINCINPQKAAEFKDLKFLEANLLRHRGKGKDLSNCFAKQTG